MSVVNITEKTDLALRRLTCISPYECFVAWMFEELRQGECSVFLIVVMFGLIGWLLILV